MSVRFSSGPIPWPTDCSTHSGRTAVSGEPGPAQPFAVMLAIFILSERNAAQMFGKVEIRVGIAVSGRRSASFFVAAEVGKGRGDPALIERHRVRVLEPLMTRFLEDDSSNSVEQCLVAGETVQHVLGHARDIVPVVIV